MQNGSLERNPIVSTITFRKCDLVKIMNWLRVKNFIGTAGEMVAPEVKTYEGFTSPEKQYYELSGIG